MTNQSREIQLYGMTTEDIREQYERQLRDLQEAYGEAMLELRAGKQFQSLLGKDEP